MKTRRHVIYFDTVSNVTTAELRELLVQVIMEDDQAARALLEMNVSNVDDDLNRLREIDMTNVDVDPTP